MTSYRMLERDVVKVEKWISSRPPGTKFSSSDIASDHRQISPRKIGAILGRSEVCEVVVRKGTGTVTIDMRKLGEHNPYHTTWMYDYDYEPYAERLIRYREAYEGLVVVDNGGHPVVKDSLTTPEEVKA